MAGFAALVALLFFAIPAQADEIEPEPVPDVVSEEEEVSEPAWIPSLDVGFEGFRYDIDTTIVNLKDPSSRSGTQGASVNQLMFRIGGELMGPMFENLPGRPRLFVQGGVGLSTFSGEEVFGIGDPDDDDDPVDDILIYRCEVLPCTIKNGPRTRDLPFDFKGQGSRLDAKFQDPSWYAGLGIAFSVPTSSGMLFYIKPSVQYRAEEIDFTGKLKTVFEPPGGPVDPPPCAPLPCTGGPFTRDFEIHESNAKFGTTDHSIGPGLEVAMAFRPVGPIRISLFGQVQALWLVSGTTTSFTDPKGVASYRVVRDDFSFRGGAGVRLSWVGFD